MHFILDHLITGFYPGRNKPYRLAQTFGSGFYIKSFQSSGIADLTAPFVELFAYFETNGANILYK